MSEYMQSIRGQDVYKRQIEEGTSDGDYNELESYEYEKGEYLSSLEIYEVNGIKSAYLGFWHNYRCV